MKNKDKIFLGLLGLRLSWAEEIALRNRKTVEQVIQDVFEISKRFWFESEKASLFWDGRGWSVNKMVEDEADFIIHEYEEKELPLAIAQFIEHSLDDRLGATDEEALFINGESNG